MFKFGVSVYPEKESIEEITAYLKLASDNGFNKVFTSVFTVEGTKEEVVAYFKKLTTIAHEFGMEVDGDVNPMTFKLLGADEKNLAVFKEMGLDQLRMDMAYMNEKDAILINNKEGIKIEMSAAMKPVIESVLKYDFNRDNMTVCHNFFPQRYTGIGLKPFMTNNNYYKANGLKVGAFITSQNHPTHGPWLQTDGLPTIEDHRDWPIALQLKHMIACKNVDEIIIGNAFASKEEFESMKPIIAACDYKIDLGPMAAAINVEDMMPGFAKYKFLFNVNKEPDISPIEEVAAYTDSNGMHLYMGDESDYMVRDRAGRMKFKKEVFTPRPVECEYFTKGDIVVINDNLGHYHGETQIVLKDMKNDGTRNKVGRIVDEEIFLLDYMINGDLFKFIY